MVKVLKMPREVLITQPLTRWICSILKSGGELSTKEIWRRIHEYFPFVMEFPKGLAERTVLDYLNTMDMKGIVNKKVRGKNVAFWGLQEGLRTDIVESLARMDKTRISRTASAGEAWNYSENGITFYEFPRFHMDGDKKLMEEFDSILHDLKNSRRRLYYLTGKVLEAWRKKIIHKIIEKDTQDILGKQLGIICCFFIYYHNRSNLKKWLGEDWLQWMKGKVKPDIELAELLKKIFYPSKTRGELLTMIKDYKVDTHILKTIFAFYTLDKEYSISIPSTIVIRIPEPQFDEWVYNTIKEEYCKEEEGIGISYSDELELLEERMKEHRGDFYELTAGDDKSMGKEIDVSKIKSFIKKYAPDILSESETH